ncbi:hypothetical protein WBN73_08890 [Paenarthrobacter sp. CCNWLY172]|uniref:hypothetical protein n=1 Tax=unclassified Paenarthrobacter TaxID=2634190 RepID=UPI002468662C|nr:hypothetical protein [Paenarthrobacter sp. OM7]WGM20753.1 hypothetical protein QEH68_00745 [Paenarthrobacter sp. OM7]
MRPINDTELEILNRLLSMEFEGVSEFRKQAMNIIGVESDCICGCPSIAIQVDRTKAPGAPWTRLLPAELEELSHPTGVPSSVLCLLDQDGYLASLEFVYYDDVVTEWPPSNRCAVVLRGSERNPSSVSLSGGALVKPHDMEDPWTSFEGVDMGFRATTLNGWTETYGSNGQLVSRVFGQT